ncbi:MAG: DUF302 domain-containing protein [Candidatus Kapaibacteriales bacterium]
MKYEFSKTTDYTFEEDIQKIADELKKEGFGAITTIDVKDTFKNRLDVDFEKYTILGTCSPKLTY